MYLYFYVVVKTSNVFLPTDKPFCKWWVCYPVEKKGCDSTCYMWIVLDSSMHFLSL